ncbi:MAG: sugar phosphate isomerase/epimerase [Candidatus Sumerlaeota bacterium]|nr:sugar phosphate isomerase/epimerase [Candidatus Sumerlaeota bacterium]
MSKPCLGAQLYTLREYCKTLPDVITTFKKVSDIGYKAVQISGFGPVDPKELAKVIADSGLIVAATHMGWNRFLNELDAVIAEHKMWKCHHTAIGGLPGEYGTLDGLKRFAAEVPPVAARLAKEGMTFSYHNHHHEFIKHGGKTWLEAAFEMISAKDMCFEIDTHWVQRGGGDPAAWVRKCAGRIPLLHLKDMAVSDKREPLMAPIGEGNLNWDAILDAARQSGVEWYLIEQDDCYGRDPFECLGSSYRFLRGKGLS